MSDEQTPEEREEGRRKIKKILAIHGIIFAFAGLFLLLKDKFSDWVFLDPSTDFYLGTGFFFVGIADYIIAHTIFSDKKTS